MAINTINLMLTSVKVNNNLIENVENIFANKKKKRTTVNATLCHHLTQTLSTPLPLPLPQPMLYQACLMVFVTRLLVENFQLIIAKLLPASCKLSPLSSTCPICSSPVSISVSLRSLFSIYVLHMFSFSSQFGLLPSRGFLSASTVGQVMP